MARYVLRHKATGKFSVGHGSYASFSGDSLEQAKVYRTRNGGTTYADGKRLTADDVEWLPVELRIVETGP